MKKLLFTFPIVVLLASGCNSNQANTQNKPQPNPSQSVAQAKLNIIYPAGGEVLSLNSTIGIKYAISNNFAKQLTQQDTSELYLLDATGTIVGFIGTINLVEPIYSWEPSDLGHWAGLDIVSQIPTAGNYKILLVSRQKTKPNTSADDYPADIFIDNVTKFDGTKIVVTNSSQSVYPDILAYAVSNIFSLQDTVAGNTSDWKTYTSPHLGLTFKYPQVWGVPVENYFVPSSGICENSCKGEDVTISFSKDSLNKTKYPNLFAVSQDFNSFEGVMPYVGIGTVDQHAQSDEDEYKTSAVEGLLGSNHPTATYFTAGAGLGGSIGINTIIKINSNPFYGLEVSQDLNEYGDYPTEQQMTQFISDAQNNRLDQATQLKVNEFNLFVSTFQFSN